MQVSFYGLNELVELAVGKLVGIKYGTNPQMLSLLKQRGLPIR